MSASSMLTGHSEDGVSPRNPSSIAMAREIPHFVRDDKDGLVGGDKNVGAPTFKVILEVRLDVTNSQNGNAPEVIA